MVLPENADPETEAYEGQGLGIMFVYGVWIRALLSRRQSARQAMRSRHLYEMLPALSTLHNKTEKIA